MVEVGRKIIFFFKNSAEQNFQDGVLLSFHLKLVKSVMGIPTVNLLNRTLVCSPGNFILFFFTKRGFSDIFHFTSL